MKVLTLHQPWASLIALGVKSIETRSWSTKYRGPLAIHAAAKRPTRQSVGDWLPWPTMTDTWTMEHYASGEIGAPPDAPLPLGAIVATCTLVDVVPVVEWGADPQADHITLGKDGHLRSYLFTPNLLPLTWKKRDPFDVTDQRPYGDFTPGRFAWLLADVAPVNPPEPFKGGQGLTKTWAP